MTTVRLLLALTVLTGTTVLAQETQTLTLEQCEAVFLKKNLMLLAQQYNISSKQALILQAKTYPNPMLSADLNFYDPQNNRYFHVDSSGQKAFAVEQLILLGGKRRLEIDIAKENASLAEAEFSDLFRNLVAELQRLFFSVNSANIAIRNYQQQLAILDTIIGAYKEQTQKGNLPLKDLVRLKSVYIKLNSNRSMLLQEVTENQKQLKLLLHSSADIYPLVPENVYTRYTNLKSLNDLLTVAIDNRPDLKIADKQAVLAELNLRRQKKQRVPDLALNASYDQRGGAFKNQINAGVSLPLPVLNTYRGSIKAAQYEKQAMDAYVQDKKLEVELDVQQAWLNMQQCINDYVKVKTLYNQEFSDVNKGMIDNFNLRNISIVEFVDFVEAYNESLADFELIKKQLAQAAAKVNYVTATKIY